MDSDPSSATYKPEVTLPYCVYKMRVTTVSAFRIAVKINIKELRSVPGTR
jgi:hypothetical protein